MAAKKLTNVNEALECLENLDVSSENELSADEDFISRRSLVPLPPNDEGHEDSNEDSGDENVVLLNNLNRS